VDHILIDFVEKIFNKDFNKPIIIHQEQKTIFVNILVSVSLIFIQCHVMQMWSFKSNIWLLVIKLQTISEAINSNIYISDEQFNKNSPARR